MRAHNALLGFMFQTDNGEFNSKACRYLVAASGGKLITNCLSSPETMSIIERSWRTIGQTAIVMLLHCGMAEHLWEVANLYAVDIIIVYRWRRPIGQDYVSPHSKRCTGRYHHSMTSARSAAGAMSLYQFMGKLTSVVRSKSCT